MKRRRGLADDAQHDVAASAAHERTCRRQACRLCAAKPPWAHLRGSSPKVPMTRRPPPWTRLRGCSSVVALARVWLQSRNNFRSDARFPTLSSAKSLVLVGCSHPSGTKLVSKSIKLWRETLTSLQERRRIMLGHQQSDLCRGHNEGGQCQGHQESGLCWAIKKAAWRPMLGP